MKSVTSIVARFAESIRGNRFARDVLSGKEFDLAAGLTLPSKSATVLELSGAPPVPPGVTGTLRTHESVSSKFVDARRVDVWLPPGYEKDPSRRFPVLYMHDGQNLFDPALSYIGVDWGMDEAMTKLAADGLVREAIIVGVWNTPKRFQEYMPAKAITESGLPESWQDMAWMTKERIVSDDYLRFLVEELKPFVDSSYRTLPGRDDTFIMGSSMGAFISLYALTEYSGVFGGAGCVSIHWPLGDGIMIDYLARHLPARGSESHLLRFRDCDARRWLRAVPAACGCIAARRGLARRRRLSDAEIPGRRALRARLEGARRSATRIPARPARRSEPVVHAHQVLRAVLLVVHDPRLVLRVGDVRLVRHVVDLEQEL